MLKNFAKKLWTQSPEQWVGDLTGKNGLRRNGGPERLVWCLSTGRVGTQTLAHLARLDDTIYADHEPSPNLFALSNLGYHHAGKEDCSAILAESFRLARESVKTCGRAVYVETSPQVTFLAPIIKKVFPQSVFIHVVRDHFEVIRSGMRRGWYDGHPYDQWRLVPGEKADIDWLELSLLEKNAWLWAETNRWIMQFLKSVDDSESHILQSGDLFSGNQGEISRFFAFLGVASPESELIEKVLGKKLNSQKTGSYPSAGDWNREDRKRVEKWTGEMMASLGFD